MLLHSVTAWIFGLQIARTWWNTSLMAPLFVVSAILSGTALVTLIALAAERWGGFNLPADTRRWLRGFVTVALIVDLFFVGCDYVTVLWGNVPADRSALNLVLPGGAFSWTFWGEWIVGGVVPLLFLLVPRLRRLPGSLGLAAFLSIVGVYIFRIELVVIGFINPLTQYPPGNALGTYNAVDDLVPTCRALRPHLGRVRDRHWPRRPVRRHPDLWLPAFGAGGLAALVPPG